MENMKSFVLIFIPSFTKVGLTFHLPSWLHSLPKYSWFYSELSHQHTHAVIHSKFGNGWWLCLYSKAFPLTDDLFFILSMLQPWESVLSLDSLVSLLSLEYFAQTFARLFIFYIFEKLWNQFSWVQISFLQDKSWQSTNQHLYLGSTHFFSKWHLISSNIFSCNIGTIVKDNPQFNLSKNEFLFPAFYQDLNPDYRLPPL